jgi:hypothetical protein
MVGRRNSVRLPDLSEIKVSASAMSSTISLRKESSGWTEGRASLTLEEPVYRNYVTLEEPDRAARVPSQRRPPKEARNGRSVHASHV